MSWLPILSGVIGVLGISLTIYKIVDDKIGTRKKELDALREKLADHENRIRAAERVTETVENFMDELLIDSLRRNKRRQ